MARTVEDVLARRTRALFLNAKAALRMAPKVAALLAQELKRDKKWQLDQIEQFNQVAAGFVVKL
jgi:glycerol-3-phosphate dehydrogenase